MRPRCGTMACSRRSLQTPSSSRNEDWESFFLYAVGGALPAATVVRRCATVCWLSQRAKLRVRLGHRWLQSAPGQVSRRRSSVSPQSWTWAGRAAAPRGDGGAPLTQRARHAAPRIADCVSRGPALGHTAGHRSRVQLCRDLRRQARPDAGARDRRIDPLRERSGSNCLADADRRRQRQVPLLGPPISPRRLEPWRRARDRLLLLGHLGGDAR